MKTLTLFITASLTLIGCGKEHPPHIEPEVQKYVDKFYQESASYGTYPDTSKLSVRFVDSILTTSSGLVFSYCEYPTVYIVKDFWLKAGETKKVVMLYHELGHCVLEEEHRAGWNKELDIPLSLMEPDSDLVVDYFEAHRAYYMKELLTHYSIPPP